jgi:signal transduction histidine kinase/ligand-binding sensor domain-containing protein/DNA-binding response OmpR family regulator
MMQSSLITKDKFLFLRKKLVLAKNLLLAIFLFLGICCLQAQTEQFFSKGYYVEQYTAYDGLPGNSVKDIIQGQKGFLWMATHHGLIRYDGYRFESFLLDTLSGEGVYNNFVYTLHQDCSGQIWAGTLNDGLYVFDPQREKMIHHFSYEAGNPQSLCSDWVRDIIEDEKGNIWVSTLSGLNKINQGEGQYVTDAFQTRDSSSSYDQFHQLAADRYVLNVLGGRLTIRDSLTLWHAGGPGIDVVSHRSGDLQFSGIGLDAIFESFSEVSNLTVLSKRSEGRYWLTGRQEQENGEHHNLLGLWDPASGSLWNIRHQIPADTRIEQLYEDAQGHLWIGTWGRGLYLLENVVSDGEKINTAPIQRNIPLMEGSGEETGNIWKLFPDQFGNLWVGTWRSHLYKIHLTGKTEDYFHLFSAEQELIKPGNMAEGPNGDLWLTTKEGMLFRRTVPSGALSSFDLPKAETSRTVDTPAPIAKGAGEALWIGSYQGLIRFSTTSGQVQLYPLERTDKNLENDWINRLFYSDKYGLFCGTSHGSIYLFDTQSFTFEALHEEYTNLGVINDLLITSDQQLLASTNRGLHRFELEEPTRQSFVELNGGALDLHEASNGDLWLGTYLGGLKKLNKELEVDKDYLEGPGLSPSWITAISEDRSGHLWLVSPEGMYRFSPATESFETFSLFNPFPLAKVAAVTGIYQNKEGRLFVAGEEGVFNFFSKKIEPVAFRPIPVIKDLLINNQRFRQASEYSDLPSGGYLKNISLAYHKNDLAIEYAGLQYDYPQEVEYRYRLEGFQNDWVAVGKEKTARFPNLTPGKYKFRVMAKNGDGLWSEAEAVLSFRILRPWWQTYWAYALYLVAAIALGVLFYRYQLNRKLALAEAHRLKELDEVKSKLYTNITHEFRTPITIIQGMAEQSLKYFRANSFRRMEDALQTIQRNSRELLRLVNQMLDLSKMEAGALQLQLIQGDVVNFLGYLSESFHTFAQSKNIQLVTYKEQNSLLMDYDPEKLKNVFSNLLSNAVKFTPEGGKIIFHIKKGGRNEAPCLIVKVKDFGIGIPADKLPYIFDRFYQVDDAGTRKGEGTGIGLAHTKELVQLMGGTIEVDSRLDEGSTFTVILPIRTKAPLKEHVELNFSLHEGAEADTTQANSTGNKEEGQSTILIVEDNKDVRKYLQSCLEQSYHLILANNGKEGIQKAQEHIPDLIISDVMMPLKTGFELCQTLKNEELTSHIPIILLTAKADEKARIQGLGTGADAYLVKPFNQEELSVRLQQMIKLRKRLQERYQTALPFDLNIHSANHTEDRFMRKVQVLLETHLSNEQFNVTLLIRELGMSRSQLFRKFKALTGQSVTQYMRTYRMQRALELLKNSALSVSEVAYRVGFKDPAYFSRVFFQPFWLCTE